MKALVQSTTAHLPQCVQIEQVARWFCSLGFYILIKLSLHYIYIYVYCSYSKILASLFLDIQYPAYYLNSRMHPEKVSPKERKSMRFSGVKSRHQSFIVILIKPSRFANRHPWQWNAFLKLVRTLIWMQLFWMYSFLCCLHLYSLISETTSMWNPYSC